jgi:hypothetical protein
MKKVICDIKKILKSRKFRKDLKNISHYAMSIKQERPILFQIANHFFKNGYLTVLEKDKTDLVLKKNNELIKIEAKYHFDFDLVKVKEELEKESFYEMINKINRKKNINWTIVPTILKDLAPKRIKERNKPQPDIFIWIISKRNILKVDNYYYKSICMANHQLSYQNSRSLSFNENEIINKLAKKLIAFLDNNYDYFSHKINLKKGFLPTQYFFIVLYKNTIQ